MAQVTAAFVKVVAQVAGGAVFVVGQRLDDDSDAARSISFVHHVDVGVFIAFARGLFDDAVNVVVGNVVGLCFCDQIAQLAVVHRVRSTFTDRHRHLTADLGEDFSLLGVSLFFFALDIVPFRMSGHCKNSLSILSIGFLAAKPKSFIYQLLSSRNQNHFITKRRMIQAFFPPSPRTEEGMEGPIKVAVALPIPF